MSLLKFSFNTLVFCTVLVFSANNALAQQDPTDIQISSKRAEGEYLASASGFYARSRHFIIKAIQEFDMGARKVDPSALIDIAMWRNILLDRAEDLERVLTIQPEANSSGVNFAPEDRYINNKYLKPQSSTPKLGVSIRDAKGSRLKKGIRHFVQARGLLMTAVREFDSGMRMANPQALVNISEWRNSVLDRAEDLDRIVAPKARETEIGVSFSPDNRLLNGSIR